MNWRAVRLIWFREMRDQLRDQRTLFMVAVLPVLMYPLLGTSFFQLAQFMQQHTARVVVAGAEQLQDAADAGLPPLLEGERFAASLLESAEDARRLAIERVNAEAVASPAVGAPQDRLARGEADVILIFPEGFADRLAELQQQLETRRRSGKPPEPAPVVAPRPTVLYNSARERSQVAHLRVERLLQRWQRQVVRANLDAIEAPAVATQPFGFERTDVASRESRDARLWSKLLPFIVFVWALTGAFYPAIDLCPGEKERGTLETLLASPARRSEIVGGKLLTVMTFSIFTACLNLLSLSVTARVVIGQLASLQPAGAMPIAPPALSAMLWLLVALVPIAALFSALSLACAAYARSTKEGQYYFMPLFLVAMPLMLLPMSPGVELHLGNSLVPLMGLALLLRGMIEGRALEVAPYALPAIAMTGVCCWLAMRWAVAQFNEESVLFREGERLSARGWFASVVRRREATPSPGAAIACVAGIFIAQFVVRQGLAAFPPSAITTGYLAVTVLLSQIVCVLAPALAVVWLLAGDWRKTLLMERPWRPWPIAAAAAMAVALHPVGQRLSLWVQQLYPPSDELQQELLVLQEGLFGAPWPLLVLLLAALPAVCEEIAFRGVLLSGLRKSLGGGGAVLLTAALFGATHTVLQQSLAAAPVGVVIGLIALRTRSLPACIAFHGVYNALQLLTAKFGDTLRAATEAIGLRETVFAEIDGEPVGYAPVIVILGAVAALALVRVLAGTVCGNPHSEPRLTAAS